MSWSLFCHNANVLGVAPVVIPPAGTEITATLINSGSGPATPEQLIATGGTNKILFRKTEDRFAYSGNGGDTWSDVGFVPLYASGLRVHQIEYDAISGFWFFMGRIVSDTVYYRSGDNGSTWTEMTQPTLPSNNNTTSLVIDYLGRMVTATANVALGSGCTIYRWNTPSTTLTHDESYVVSSSSSFNTDNFKELDGYGYAISRWTGSIQNVHLVPYDLSSNQYIQPLSLHDGTEDNVAWSYSRGGKVFVWEDAASGNPQFIPIYNGMVASPKAQLSIDFSVSTQAHRIQAGSEYWLAFGQPSEASVWMLQASADGNTFGNEVRLLLPSDPISDLSTGTYPFNLFHMGGTRWIAHYPTAALTYDLVRFDFGSTGGTGIGVQDTAIQAQAPDIYMRMDDVGSPASVRDEGRKQYVNATTGALVFEQAGLVDDDGTAVLINAASAAGILVESVPSPVEHAHVFYLEHDGTATVRILASSGNIAAPTTLSYYIFLAANHKVGIATHDGNAWVYNYSTAIIATNTATLFAVRIKPNGDVTMYVGAGLDNEVTGADVKALSATKLSLGGAWDGATLDDSADGVTLDYYVLIPNAYFDYSKLATAFGLTYVPPAPPPGTVTPIFTVHADTAATGPLAVTTTTDHYFLQNAVPGSPNSVRSEVSNVVDTTLGKFGAGSMRAPSRGTGGGAFPFDIAFWNEGHLAAGIARRAFTYDVWVRPEWPNGYCYAGGNKGLWRQAGRYYVFGGIAIAVAAGEGGVGNMRVEIGTSIERAKAGHGDDLKIHWTGIPGWNAGGWNHIAVCRSIGSSGESLWHGFINGNRGDVPAVTANLPGAYSDTNILAGGQWLLGSVMYVGTQGSTISGRFTPPCHLDEARLIIGEAVFTEPFTPPIAAYSYA